MRLVLALSAAAVLMGCGASRQQEAIDQMEANKAACRSAPRTTFVALARCINAAEQYGFAQSPISPDLVSVRLATRLSIAERQDRGQLTESEAELEFAKAVSDLVGTAQQRMNNATAANAQASAAASARMSAINQSFQQPTFRPTFQPQQQYRLQANCRTYSIGNQIYTNCN